MKLKLLFVNSIKLMGGGEVWTINTIKELINRGHSVTLICEDDSAIKQKAIQNGIEVISFKFKGDFDPPSVYKLNRIINTRKIDIIITNMHKEQRLCGAAAKMSGNAKVISVRHVDIPIKNNLYYRFTYNTLTDKVVVNSFATKNTLLSSASWLRQDKIKVIYHGIDTKLFAVSGKSTREELNIPNDKPVIGFVGRLNVQKGIVYMMDAFKIIKGKIPDAQLLIAGTGDLYEEIVKKSDEYGYSNSVYLLGFREDIPDILNSIDVLLLPSLWEGFGLVLIEAMACGKPCVTTSVSSMPEIVEDGVSGFILPPKDPAALAEACCKLLTNPQLADDMGKQGKWIVNEKFTLKKMIYEYEDLFFSICRKST